MSVNCSLDIAVSSANTGLDAIKRAPIVKHDTGIKCLRIQDVSQCKEYDNWGFTEVTPNNFSKFQLKKDDILIARTGGSIGVNRYIAEDVQAVYNNGLIRIRVDTEKYYPKFVYYLLRTESFKQHINSIAFSTAAQPNMKIRDFLRFEFFDLELEQQIYIADMLSELDDKIELNRQTNQTLEQIAQAIFKSWFVDFDPAKAKIIAKQKGGDELAQSLAAQACICGAISLEQLQNLQHDYPKLEDQLHPLITQRFPDEFGLDYWSPETLETTADLFPNALVESELGEVPEGWGVKTFGDISQCFDSKRVPLSKKKREEKKPGCIPYYGATSIMDYVNEWIFDDVYLLLGEDGSVLKEDGTPFVQYIWGKAWINNHAHVLQGKDGVTTEQLMLFMQQTNISAYVTGAVQLKLNQKNMNSIPFLDAGIEINKVFYDLIKPMYETHRNIFEQNKILSQLRDSLLPKLLSGEVAVDLANSGEAAVA